MKTSDQGYRWAYLIDRVRRTLETHDESETEWILEGWKYLREFYREEGLQWLLHTDEVGRQLTNELLWARIFIGHIGNCFKHLSKRDDFPILKPRLLNKDQFDSARFEAELAYHLDEKGIQNQFLEPAADPKPDLLVEVMGKQVCFEAHRQSNPRHPLFYDRFTSDLYKHLDLRDVIHTGIIHRPISQIHWKEIIESCKKAVEEARNEEKLVEVVEDWIAGPIVELAFAPSILKEKLLAWKDVRYKSHFTDVIPPIFDTDKAKRINRSIKRKVRQILPNLPGVIVIDNVNFRFRINTDTCKPIDTRDYSWDFLSRIAEFVYDIPTIAYVIMRGNEMGRDLTEYECEFNSIWICRKKRYYEIYDDIVVIRNRFSKHKPIPEIVEIFI